MEFGTPEQKARFLPKMARSEEVWAQGWSEPNAGSDMAAIRASARLDGDHYVLQRPEDLVLARRLRRLALRHVPHRSRLRAPQGPDLHPGAARHARRHACGRSRSSTARPASPRSSSTTRACRVANRLGDEGTGLEGRDGDGRLRARPHAAQPGALPGDGAPPGRALPEAARGATPIPALRDAVVARLDGRRGLLRSPPIATASRLLAGGKIGAEASLNKIFWSELDMKMHETALALLGAPRRSCCPARPPPATSASWLDGYLFSLAGPIYAGTNEIQTQHHRRAHARPAARADGATCTSHSTEDQRLLPADRARLPRRGVPRRRSCAASGRRATGRSPRVLERSSPSSACSGCSCPRRRRPRARRESTSCSLLDETGRAALAEPVVATAVVGVPLLREAGERAPTLRRSRTWLPTRRRRRGARSPSAQPSSTRSSPDADVADLLLLAQRRRAPRRAARGRDR